jgi:hypothetical protein
VSFIYLFCECHGNFNSRFKKQNIHNFIVLKEKLVSIATKITESSFTKERDMKPKNFFNCLVILLFTVFLLIIGTAETLNAACTTDDGWKLETVDSEGYVGEYTSIAIDSSGNAHISYFDESNDKLKYATNAGGSWSTTTVDSAGNAYIGISTSIALDSSGNAHISYNETLDLRYATNAGGSWSTTTVDSAGNVGMLYASIALDSSGNAHISYDENLNLRYATNAGGSWSTTTVDSEGYVGEYTSIAIDSSGNAHISYTEYYYNDGPDYDLKYATNAGGSWSTTTVDSEGYVGVYTSIALDSSGNAHISYFDGSNYDLKYATNAGGSWSTTTVDSTGDVGMYTSIALDSSGNVHISYTEYNYYDGSNDDLKYATNEGGNWNITTVDSTGNTNKYTYIALDSSGNAHISYYDGSNYDLKYATDTPDGDCDGYISNIDCDDNDNTVYPGAAEVCDNLDNNCDGTVDSFTRQTSCGTGACAAAGIETCTAGVWGGNTCTPGTPAADDATCDGVDDDCDGTNDDDYASVTISCGIGACAATGSTSCVSGAVQEFCTPGTPSAEICDGLDNDCDYTIDDGVLNTYYEDLDGDTYGNLSYIQVCDAVPPAGYASDDTDCDDTDASVNPGQSEIPNNGKDDNCNADFFVYTGDPGEGKFYAVNTEPFTETLAAYWGDEC